MIIKMKSLITHLLLPCGTLASQGLGAVSGSPSLTAGAAWLQQIRDLNSKQCSAVQCSAVQGIGRVREGLEIFIGLLDWDENGIGIGMGYEIR